MNKHKSTLGGISGTLAILFFELIKYFLSPTISEVKLVLLLTILSTFSIYVLSFQFLNYFDNKYLWKYYMPRLNGKWKLHLVNLEDKSERTGDVSIFQTRDKLLITAINYRDNVKDAYSSWKSIEAIINNNELFFTYEVESAIDIKPFKRGFMKFTFLERVPGELIGNYYDSAPSNCQGPILLKKNDIR